MTLPNNIVEPTEPLDFQHLVGSVCVFDSSSISPFFRSDARLEFSRILHPTIPGGAAQRETPARSARDRFEVS
jgi:hypothetical protein